MVDVILWVMACAAVAFSGALGFQARRMRRRLDRVERLAGIATADRLAWPREELSDGEE